MLTSPACRNCDQDIFTVRGNCTKFCILSQVSEETHSRWCTTSMCSSGEQPGWFHQRQHTEQSSPDLEAILAPGLPTALARAVTNTILPAAKAGSPTTRILATPHKQEATTGQSCPVLQRCKPKNIEQTTGQALIFLVLPMPDKKYFQWSLLQTYQMLNCRAINTPESRKTKLLGLPAHM